MIVNVSFDTTTKALDVSVDGGKMENVSEVEFYGFGDNEGSVSIRQFEEMKDDKAFKMTKIMASEDGEYLVDEQDDILTTDIARRLFPNRRI